MVDEIRFIKIKSWNETFKQHLPSTFTIFLFYEITENFRGKVKKIN
jgi:hypothetical protein